MPVPKYYSCSRKKHGATMSIIIALITILVLIGVTFLYISQMVGGDMQLARATDAGALAAAQGIGAITLTPAQVAALPQEFTGLGVDSSGNICPSGKDSNGNPAKFGVVALDNCGGYTLEIAFNAADSGSPSAINSAIKDIEAYNTFAAQLDANIQAAASTSLTSAASNMMSNESLTDLPGKLFKKAQTGANLQSGPTLAYYAIRNASAPVYFPTTYATKDSNITKWVNKVLSTTASNNGGPNLIAGGKAFDINTITGSTAFVGSDGKDLKMALVSMQSGQETHLVSPTSESFYTGSLPGMSGVSLPHNALSLIGQSNDSSALPGGNGARVKLGSGSSNLNLTVCSAAVLNTPGQYAAYIPASDGSPSGGGCAYVALVNGGDFQASLNAAGLTSTYLQTKGFSNVPLTAATNIAFNGAQTDIFDVLDWNPYENDSDWIIIGTNSVTGMYSIYQSEGTRGLYSTILNSQQNFPASNYNDVVDNPNLTSTTPSVPFAFLADYENDAWEGEANLPAETTINASLGQCMTDFGAWIAYNNSTGTDALGRNSALDPLGPNVSPAMFAKNPNSVVPNTLISATSDFMQYMTIADALQIKDICVFHDGQWVFTGSQPEWMNNVMPVVASNYGFNYLPTPVTGGEYKPNGFTGIEYAKVQNILVHAGLLLSENPPILPSSPGRIYLPLSNVPLFTYPAAANVSSGMKYFVPYDTNGNLAHYPWPEAPGCPQFETPGTPGQYLQNINLFNNSGKFNASDTKYNAILNAILAVVQKMSPNITLADLNTVLSSPTSDTGQTGLDLGQTVFLIYNSSVNQNHGLQMVSTLPAGTTYQPPDGSQAATYIATFPIAGYVGDAITENAFTLVDSSAAPTSTVMLPNGTTITPAPYGDSEMHKAPYNQLIPYTIVDGNSSVNAVDTATFWTSSGANNNHGTIYFTETVGDSFEIECIN